MCERFLKQNNHLCTMQSTNHLMFEEQIKQEMKSLKALALQLTRNMDDA